MSARQGAWILAATAVPLVATASGAAAQVGHLKDTIEAEKEAELRQALSAQQFGEFLPSKEEMRKQFETKIKQAAPGN
jgi:hypothetical protein